MAQVVLFHSAYGLRQAEASAAARLRAVGREVITPDLYGGQTAGTLDAALALMDAVGWDLICAAVRCLKACRARDRRRGAEPGNMVSCAHLARPA